MQWEEVADRVEAEE